MVGSLKTDGTTYLPSGLAWGWRVLDDDIPFGRPMPGEPRQKALVLMTDGYNTVSREGRKPYIVNDGRYHHGKYEGDESVITTANGITKTLCENIAAQDIEIYTIAYALPASANSDATRTLLRQCAGSTGQFFDAQDSMQLAKAFSAIAEAQAFESNVRLID